MKRVIVGFGVMGYLGCGFVLVGLAQTEPPLPAQEEPEYLAQGPVHEAFAVPVNLSEEQSFVAPVAPPRLVIDEAMGEQPTPQAVWIAGYWAWDVERNIYIWVSGCWRIPPTSKHWSAGYWTETDKGWLWTPGYWADNAQARQAIEYLPAPPALANVAPPIEAPSLNVVWVPPCWYWRSGRYVLRSGYWLDAMPGWVWQPSHYVSTARGHVFVSGYWDYPLSSRGVLFAPVLLPAPVIRRPTFSLSLGLSINLGWMELNLFSAPRYGHYYFGDYYDASYVSFGIFPSFSYRSSWGWYDSLYEYRRWSGRKGGDSHWDDRDRRYFDNRRNDKTLRPPKTYHEMTQRPPSPPRPPAGHPDRPGSRPGGPRDDHGDRGMPLIKVGTGKGAAVSMPSSAVGGSRTKANGGNDDKGRGSSDGPRRDEERPRLRPPTDRPVRDSGVDIGARAPRRPSAPATPPAAIRPAAPSAPATPPAAINPVTSGAPTTPDKGRPPRVERDGGGEGRPQGGGRRHDDRHGADSSGLRLKEPDSGRGSDPGRFTGSGRESGLPPPSASGSFAPAPERTVSTVGGGGPASVPATSPRAVTPVNASAGSAIQRPYTTPAQTKSQPSRALTLPGRASTPEPVAPVVTPPQVSPPQVSPPGATPPPVSAPRMPPGRVPTVGSAARAPQPYTPPSVTPSAEAQPEATPSNSGSRRWRAPKMRKR